MWFVVLPLVNPAMLQLDLVIFLLAHMLWGAALGLALGWVASPQTRLGNAHA